VGQHHLHLKHDAPLPVGRACRAERKASWDLYEHDQAWRLADIWYRDRADPSWGRRTAEEAEFVFGDLGLTGDFWTLRR
jgi:hypothetical protein